MAHPTGRSGAIAWPAALAGIVSDAAGQPEVITLAVVVSVVLLGLLLRKL